MSDDVERPPRRLRNRLIVLLVLLALTVVGLDFVLRAVVSPGATPDVATVERLAAAARAEAGEWRIDGRLGRVPVLEVRRTYDPFGLRQGWRTRGSVAAKREGVTRLLHLGDGVTARATVLQPLRDLWRGGQAEFLNAGVPGFDPAASVVFYLQHQQQLLADHVVVWLRDEALQPELLGCLVDGEFVLAAPGFTAPVDLDWYRRSMLYRLWALAGHDGSEAAVLARRAERAQLVEAALRRLQAEIGARSARLSVVLLPGAAGEDEVRSTLLGILGRLGIEHVDLQPLAEELAEHGLPRTVEAAAGRSDPAPELAALVARAAAERLLPEAPVRMLAVPRVVQGGGAQRVTVEAPREFVGRRVVVLGSMAGITPATDLGRGRVPLGDDDYLRATAARLAPPLSGELGADGTATIAVPVPAGAVGPTIVWHCPVVLDRRGVHFELIGWPAPMVVRPPQ